jgi:uncharacterized protein (UPF0262 family)
MSESRFRLSRVTLDEATLVARGADAEHEREVAIFDLLQENVFQVVGHDGGPYVLALGVRDNRLALDIGDEAGGEVRKLALPFALFRSLVRDYFTICEAYYDAIKTASRARIETLDMGRRSLHDEGAELLRERLSGAVEVDEATSRRLFTLICALHYRGRA